MQLIGAVLSQSTSCASSISQAAAIEALTGPQDAVTDYGKVYAQRRDLVMSELATMPQLQWVPPKGAFYFLVDWTHDLGAQTPSGVTLGDDETFARYLLEEHGLATIPGSAFGKPGFIRLSYACSNQTIVDGLGALRSALTDLA